MRLWACCVRFRVTSSGPNRALGAPTPRASRFAKPCTIKHNDHQGFHTSNDNSNAWKNDNHHNARACIHSSTSNRSSPKDINSHIGIVRAVTWNFFEPLDFEAGKRRALWTPSLKPSAGAVSHVLHAWRPPWQRASTSSCPEHCNLPKPPSRSEADRGGLSPRSLGSRAALRPGLRGAVQPSPKKGSYGRPGRLSEGVPQQQGLPKRLPETSRAWQPGPGPVASSNCGRPWDQSPRAPLLRGSSLRAPQFWKLLEQVPTS